VEWRLDHGEVVTIEAGDVLVVTKLDRLAHSTLDLLRIVDQNRQE
jgi:DNA invertase Pin-like site-specific DNA recombinase